MDAQSVLSLDAIRKTLATQHLGRSLVLHQEIPSTNGDAIERGQAGAEHGLVIMAERQTAGRGRRSRTWFSPPGVNLYCSILVRPMNLRIPAVEWLSWIPLTAALAAAEAVQTAVGVTPSLKWPNDLLLQDRKVGGILCETGSDRGHQSFVVIGFGLNVNIPLELFPVDLQPTAGSLIQVTGQPVDRNRLLARLLLELEQTLGELASQGPSRLVRAYTDRCATIGRRVRVLLSADRELVGVAQAIGRDGALHVRPSGSDSPPHSAEIIEVRAADVVHLTE